MYTLLFKETLRIPDNFKNHNSQYDRGKFEAIKMKHRYVIGHCPLRYGCSEIDEVFNFN